MDTGWSDGGWARPVGICSDGGSQYAGHGRSPKPSAFRTERSGTGGSRPEETCCEGVDLDGSIPGYPGGRRGQVRAHAEAGKVPGGPVSSYGSEGSVGVT